MKRHKHTEKAPFQRITTCGEQCADIINEDKPVRNRF